MVLHLIEKLCPNLSPHFQKPRAELMSSRKAREKREAERSFQRSREKLGAPQLRNQSTHLTSQLRPFTRNGN